jgi:hypothetical protein
MKKDNPLTIAIDFDGTCVYHEYPKVGGDIGAVPVLKKLTDAGHLLILFTMRSGPELTDAVKWFMVNGIPLYGVQYNPTQAAWSASNKCYAHLYIDDAALGCPLVPYEYDEGPNGEPIDARPFVDWEKVEQLLIEKGIL